MFISGAACALLGAAPPPRAGCQAGHLLPGPGRQSPSPGMGATGSRLAAAGEEVPERRSSPASSGASFLPLRVLPCLHKRPHWCSDAVLCRGCKHEGRKEGGDRLPWHLLGAWPRGFLGRRRPLPPCSVVHSSSGGFRKSDRVTALLGPTLCMQNPRLFAAASTWEAFSLGLGRAGPCKGQLSFPPRLSLSRPAFPAAPSRADQAPCSPPVCSQCFSQHTLTCVFSAEACLSHWTVSCVRAGAVLFVRLVSLGPGTW